MGKKGAGHPHTNMAKAALNMLTCTSAGDIPPSSPPQTARAIAPMPNCQHLAVVARGAPTCAHGNSRPKIAFCVNDARIAREDSDTAHTRQCGACGQVKLHVRLCRPLAGALAQQQILMNCVDTVRAANLSGRGASIRAP